MASEAASVDSPSVLGKVNRRIGPPFVATPRTVTAHVVTNTDDLAIRVTAPSLAGARRGAERAAEAFLDSRSAEAASTRSARSAVLRSQAAAIGAPQSAAAKVLSQPSPPADQASDVVRFLSSWQPCNRPWPPYSRVIPIRERWCRRRAVPVRRMVCLQGSSPSAAGSSGCSSGLWGCAGGCGGLAACTGTICSTWTGTRCLPSYRRRQTTSRLATPTCAPASCCSKRWKAARCWRCCTWARAPAPPQTSAGGSRPRSPKSVQAWRWSTGEASARGSRIRRSTCSRLLARRAQSASELDGARFRDAAYVVASRLRDGPGGRPAGDHSGRRGPRARRRTGRADRRRRRRAVAAARDNGAPAPVWCARPRADRRGTDARRTCRNRGSGRGWQCRRFGTLTTRRGRRRTGRPLPVRSMQAPDSGPRWREWRVEAPPTSSVRWSRQSAPSH